MGATTSSKKESLRSSSSMSDRPMSDRPMSNRNRKMSGLSDIEEDRSNEVNF